MSDSQDIERQWLSRRVFLFIGGLFAGAVVAVGAFLIHQPHHTKALDPIDLDPMITVVVEGQRYGHCYLVPMMTGSQDAVICDRKLERVTTPQSPVASVIVYKGRRFEHCGVYGGLDPRGEPYQVGCVAVK